MSLDKYATSSSSAPDPRDWQPPAAPREDESVFRSSTTTRRPEVRSGGATNASLTLSNVRVSNAGTYRVIVSNDTTTASTDPAMLTVVDTELPLRLSSTLHGTNFALSWAQTCADYVLEESVSLGPLAIWTQVQPTASVAAILPIGEGSRFYRLRKLP